MNEFYQKIHNCVSAALEILFGKKMGFVILIFESDNSKIDYVTNAGNLIAAHKMRIAAEQVDPFKQFPETVGTA